MRPVAEKKEEMDTGTSSGTQKENEPKMGWSTYIPFDQDKEMGADSQVKGEQQQESGQATAASASASSNDPKGSAMKLDEVTTPMTVLDSRGKKTGQEGRELLYQADMRGDILTITGGMQENSWYKTGKFF